MLQTEINTGQGVDATEGAAAVAAASMLAAPLHTFDSFVAHGSSRLAVAAARAVAREPGYAYNPLFIHGATGLGKTHLLHALQGEALRLHPSWVIRLCTAEAFAGLLKGEAERKKSVLDDVRVLIVDDLQRLAQEDSLQQEFMQVFDSFHSQARQLVFASPVSPRSLQAFPSGLISRLQWGLVVELESLSVAARLQLIQHKSRQFGLVMSEATRGFLSENLSGSVREIEGVLHRLHSHSLLLRQIIDLPLVRAVLREYLQRPGPKASMAQVAQAVCGYFHMQRADLVSKSKVRSISYPRQIAMFLSQLLCGCSLEEIGAFFGGRDHSTVKHGIEKIRILMERDSAIRETIAGIQRQVGMAPP